MPRPVIIKCVLGSLLGLVALNAFGGGHHGLASSLLSDYLVPGLILLFIAGGAALGVAMAVFTGLPSARRLAAGVGIIIIVWIAAEAAIIGAESWLQALTAITGVAILLLSLGLPDPARS